MARSRRLAARLGSPSRSRLIAREDDANVADARLGACARVPQRPAVDESMANVGDANGLPSVGAEGLNPRPASLVAYAQGHVDGEQAEVAVVGHVVAALRGVVPDDEWRREWRHAQATSRVVGEQSRCRRGGEARQSCREDLRRDGELPNLDFIRGLVGVTRAPADGLATRLGLGDHGRTLVSREEGLVGHMGQSSRSIWRIALAE
eukprot:4380131-Prymnesium_polylepis.1